MTMNRFCLLSILLLACSIVPSVLAAEPGTPEEEALSIANDEFEAALDAHNLAAVGAYLTDDAIFDYVPIPAPIQGREAIGGFFGTVFQAFPDWTCCPNGPRRKLVSGNILVRECTVTATHQGPWLGIPATGSNLQTIHMDIYDFEGDKIKQLATYDDGMSMMIQLGLIPAPELPPLVPPFPLSDPTPTGLASLEAAENLASVWNTHDLDASAKLIQPDADILLAPLGVPMDRDAYIAAIGLYFLTYSDLQQEILRMIDMGDGWVLAEVVFKGVNDGSYFGVPATGRSVEIRGAWLTRIDTDGLVTSLHVYWDELTTLTQLGLFPPPEASLETNKQLHRQEIEEVWNQQNLDAADIFMAPDYQFHDPAESGFRGPEGYRQFVSLYLTAFPDAHFVFDDQIAEGDMVMTRWTATGTHTGNLADIPPTGVHAVTTGMNLAHIVDGQLAEEWAFWDALGQMQQLGVVEPGRTSVDDYTWQSPSDLSGDAGNPDENRALAIQASEEVWNQRNLEALDDLYSPDFVWHNPTLSGLYPRGMEGYRPAVAAHLEAFPDFHVTLHHNIAEGGIVAQHWTVTGTHQAELMGIPPSGNKVTFSGCNINRYVAGRIVEQWWAYDALGLMQQLTLPPEEDGSHMFSLPLESGLNMISLPLKPTTPYTARSFADVLSATTIIKMDASQQRFVGFTTDRPDAGFAIEGGQGYIVNVPEARTVTFTGAAWSNQSSAEAAAPTMEPMASAWAFVVNAQLEEPTWCVNITNLNTGAQFPVQMTGGHASATWANLSRQAVVHAGDWLQVIVSDASGLVGKYRYQVQTEDIRRAYATFPVTLAEMRPESSHLFANYPNPFNPETWIPYELSSDSDVALRIYDVTGALVRTLALGHRSAGFYLSRSRAVHWDGTNDHGERVASGSYFYRLEAGDFTATRRMLVIK